MLSPLYLSALGLAISLLASALHIPNGARLANRHRARVSAFANVTRRGETFSGRATYFPVGLGACGQVNVPSDMIVALNYQQFGNSYPSPYCFKSITIEYNGKQQVATIMDECPQGSCDGWGQLDMSTGLFQVFADESIGQFDMTWWFNDDPPSSSSTTTTTTSTTTTTTSTPSTTKTTSTTTTTTSATSTSASSSTTSATDPNDASVSGSATPTADSAPTNTAPAGNNMDAIGNLVVAFGEIVIAGGQA